MKKQQWYDYLWLWPIVYFTLGLFNILFAWFGMIDFLLPLFIAIVFGNKAFCNRYCGRGQLFSLLPRMITCSRKKPAPRCLASPLFRYGFLIFFLAMFGSILSQTYLVFKGTTSLREVIDLLWVFSLPWAWTHGTESAPAWAVQFGYGFYSLMLTSAVIGLIVMALYRPRTWCSFCPMGGMTQLICKAKQRGKPEPPECLPSGEAALPAHGEKTTRIS